MTDSEIEYIPMTDIENQNPKGINRIFVYVMTSIVVILLIPQFIFLMAFLNVFIQYSNMI